MSVHSDCRPANKSIRGFIKQRLQRHTELTENHDLSEYWNLSRPTINPARRFQPVTNHFIFKILPIALIDNIQFQSKLRHRIPVIS